MNGAIEHHVRKCSTCNTYAKANQKEPLLPHPISMHSWHTVGANYFNIGNLLIDFLCNVNLLKVFKNVFAWHGIPNTVIADNMSIASHSVRQFSKQWNFNITSKATDSGIDVT